MWIHGTVIWDKNYFKSTLTNFNEKVSCSVIDKEIQKIREHGGEPDLILLTYSQEDDLMRELQSQRRFIDLIPVKGYMCNVYHGIPIVTTAQFIEPMKCPICNGLTWKKNSLIFSCDKHYKQILAMNKLAG